MYCRLNIFNAFSAASRRLIRELGLQYTQWTRKGASTAELAVLPVSSDTMQTTILFNTTYLMKYLLRVRALLMTLVAVAMFLGTPGVSWAQSLTVKGMVTDAKHEALAGVSVRVKGTSNGALTGVKGDFALKGVAKNATLVFSFIGMKTQEVAVGGRSTINVVLTDDAKMTQEVVVVGYGSQKRVNLTGAVSQLDSKALTARPVQNVGQALQGMIPGLNLSVGNSGGALNSSLNIDIRGTGTIGSGSSSSPLVLIDGSEGDMNSLSANDIESISVLKDASASSIYGSRAAFGVILIKTKSGREGKARISYTGNVRFATATQVPEMMDSEMFARYFNAAATNAGNGVVFDEAAMKRILAFKNGTSEPGEESGTRWDDKRGNWSLYESAWANTNWFQEMYRPNAPTQEHNLSVSGGSGSMNYYVSGAFLDQKGIIRHGSDMFKRYNLTAKLSAKIFPWLTLSYTNRWTREEFSRPSYMTGLFFHNIARRWPTNPVYDSNGHYVPGNELIQMEGSGVDRTQKDFSAQQLTLEARPAQGIVLRAENNYNTNIGNNHWDVLSIYSHDKDGNPILTGRAGGDAGQTQVHEDAYKNNYFNGRYYGEFSKVFADKHDLKLVLGMDMEVNQHRSLGGTKKDLITNEIPTINTATNDKPSLSGGYSHWATLGYFARLNYAYDERYLLEVSLRRNGSSRFIGDKRWATFPAFSLGWNIANEAFFAPLKDQISMLKLRGSWGTLGNTEVNALYPWFLAQPVGTANSAWLLGGEQQNTANSPGLVSGTLTWERIESWNVGLDFAAFHHKLQGSFDYFNRTTRDMVGPPSPKPFTIGAGLPQINNATLVSKGWEAELKWRDQIGKVHYGARLVLSDDVQTVTEYNNPTGALNTWYPGRRIGEIWGYTSVGIAKTNEEMNEHLKNNKPSWGSNWQAGDVMYLNRTEGDNIINNGNNTLENHGDLSIIGYNAPRYKFGLNLDATWNGIDFSVFLQGIGHRDWFDNSPYSTGANHNQWQSAAFKEHWDFFRPEGDPLGANLNARFPRPLFDTGSKNFQTQTRYLVNAAYLRIKNLQVGYTLPAHLTKKWGLSRVRVYTSADNLVTFTSMPKIFDPEATGGDWGPGKIYPLQRVISFGLNVNI